MADDSKAPSRQTAVSANDDVRELARLALQRLAKPGGVRPAKSRALTDRLDDLCEAFLSDDKDDRLRMIRRLRHDGVATSQIIDHVIPAAARVLGQRWTDDTLSFVEVTIGTARLQEAVRRLIASELSCAESDISDAHEDAGAQRPKVLMVIPRPEDHTLGAFVAADQFRRFGYDVDIAVDQHPKEVAVMLQERRYRMVGITIAGRRTLASSRELVDIIRATVTCTTPIVLGGSLLESDADLKEATGVDHVARTVQDALRLCGLNIAKLDPSRTLMADHC